jgi:hypothetical protein
VSNVPGGERGRGVLHQSIKLMLADIDALVPDRLDPDTLFQQSQEELLAGDRIISLEITHMACGVAAVFDRVFNMVFGNHISFQVLVSLKATGSFSFSPVSRLHFLNMGIGKESHETLSRTLLHLLSRNPNEPVQAALLALHCGREAQR